MPYKEVIAVRCKLQETTINKMCGKAVTLVQMAEPSKYHALKRARLFIFVTISPYENVWAIEVIAPRIPNLENGRT
jgi:hypothetical protein